MDRAAWPFSGRTQELERFARLLTEPTAQGLVLAGPAGVGKTRTALECVRTVDTDRWFTARVAGHQASAELPFGALAHLLPSLNSDEEPLAKDRHELLRRYTSSLAAIGGRSRRLLLLVDDAHLLDNSSATLICQLAMTGSAFVLATVRAGEPAPDAVVALWKDGLLDRIELTGLPMEAIERLIGEALGGPVDPETTLTLASRCDGNVLFLRELVLGALEDRTLRNDNGMWRLDGSLLPSSRLVELVEARLYGLSPSERELLELVSFAEPLGQAELNAFGDRDQAELLERKGLLSVRMDRRRLEVRLAHPVYGDVIRAGLPVLRIRSMARALADAVEETGARRREDILRIGRWRLVGGGGSPQLMLAAAWAARWRHDFDLAARLVDAAIDLGGGFDAQLLAAKLQSIQGLSVPAERALSTMVDGAATDEQRCLVAIARMDNFLYANLPEKSLQVATEAEELISERAWRDEITARRSTILVTSSGPRETWQAVTPLLADGGGSALVWACLTGARSLARLGRCAEAVELTERGHAAHVALTEPIEWYPWFHLFNRCEALLSAGRLVEADELAQRQYDLGLADHSPEAQACFALQRAKVELGRGRIGSAVLRAQEAVGVFRRIGRPMFLHEALHTLALALALTGEARRSGAALAELDSMALTNLTYDAADLLHARAWNAVAQGHLPRARSLCEDAAALGRKTGDLVVTSAALHSLARFGRARDVVRGLTELEQEIDQGLVTARAAHARALLAGDPRELEEASGAFADMGADLLAADAAADAAVVWTRIGHPRAAAAATRRAIGLADRCEGASTPALRSIDARARLTTAERETAMLAAAGHSNKRIAKDLVLSVRSIENRLQRVYVKLGVSGRDELAEALNLTELHESV
ncbi:MAG TPA: AAA family ATPase [Pseudonocardia sp.]|nr:AAA family ATPase [Pseudonocardia sp.]